MKKITASLLALSLLVPAAAAVAKPKEVRIASGKLGGTYREVYAPNLAELLHGTQPLQLKSTGSKDNLERLADGRADIAFAQADVYASLQKTDPERFGVLMVIGRIDDECLYLATRVGGPVATLDALAAPIEGRAPRVAVGPAAAGPYETWSYLATLIPGLAEAVVETTAGTLALNQLAVGKTDAVLWVTDPNNLEHYNLRTVASNDAIDLLQLSDPRLVSSMDDGTQVYRARQIKLKSSWRSPTRETVCTSAMVVMRKDADPGLIEKVSNAVGLELDKIVPKQK